MLAWCNVPNCAAAWLPDISLRPDVAAEMAVWVKRLALPFRQSRYISRASHSPGTGHGAGAHCPAEPLRMSLNRVTLDDKFDLSKSRVFVTGYQALVRLTMMQHERDRHAGLNTAAYVTGYRGSPLGGLDYQFQRAAAQLVPRNVLFQPAINEDLAATALWGAQQAELRGEGKYDGVFGIWYGKGPGVH